MGHVVAEAATAAEALRDAERQHSDVALIDLRLGILARSTSLDEAARTLGSDPSTLYRKRKQYALARHGHGARLAYPATTVPGEVPSALRSSGLGAASE